MQFCTVFSNCDTEASARWLQVQEELVLESEVNGFQDAQIFNARCAFREEMQSHQLLTTVAMHELAAYWPPCFR